MRQEPPNYIQGRIKLKGVRSHGPHRCTANTRLIPELGRNGPAGKLFDMASTSAPWNPVCDGSSSLGRRNALALEFTKERSVLLASKRVGRLRSTLEQVDVASPAQSTVALLICSSIGRAEKLAFIVGDQVLHVVENVAFEDTTCAGITALEQVALDIGPDVVDSVQKSLSAERRAAAGCLGNEVVLHGDGVAGADHLENPVVVAIAAGGVVGSTVDEVAREGNAGAGREAKDVVLASGTSSLVGD